LLIDQLFEREGVARELVLDSQVMAVVATHGVVKWGSHNERGF